MKKIEKMNQTKRNMIAIIRNAGITFGMFTMLMACDTATNDESDAVQDSIANVKQVEIQKVDSTAVMDTAKKVDVNVKKP